MSEQDKGGMRFYKTMLFAMGGHLVLVGASAWLLNRLHLLSIQTGAVATVRLVAVLPLELVFALQLLGQLRNVAKGFVITLQGFVLVEFRASQEPVSFWCGLVWEFLLWGTLTYIFFRMLGQIVAG